MWCRGDAGDRKTGPIRLFAGATPMARSGPGSIDDKGLLITVFEGLEALARQGFKPRRTVMVVSGEDEEADQYVAAAALLEIARAGPGAIRWVIDEGLVVVADNPITGGRAGALIGPAEKGAATLVVTAKAEAAPSARRRTAAMHPGPRGDGDLRPRLSASLPGTRRGHGPGDVPHGPFAGAVGGGAVPGFVAAGCGMHGRRSAALQQACCTPSACHHAVVQLKENVRADRDRTGRP